MAHVDILKKCPMSCDMGLCLRIVMRQSLDCQFQELRHLLIGFRPVTCETQSDVQVRQGIDQIPKREGFALLAKLFHGSFDQVAREILFAQKLRGLLVRVGDIFRHRLADHRCKRILPLIATSHQRFNVSANLQERVLDLSRVLASELHDLCRVPHDVVLAHLLKPERGDAD